MSINAYRKTIKETANPRELEYNVLAKITADLSSAASNTDKKELYRTLFRNRRMWSHFAIDCSQSGNLLPEQTRAAIISLSIFVGRHSSKVIRDGEDVQTLININRTIMEGLSAAG